MRRVFGLFHFPSINDVLRRNLYEKILVGRKIKQRASNYFCSIFFLIYILLCFVFVFYVQWSIFETNVFFCCFNLILFWRGWINNKLLLIGCSFTKCPRNLNQFAALNGSLRKSCFLNYPSIADFWHSESKLFGRSIILWLQFWNGQKAAQRWKLCFMSTVNCIFNKFTYMQPEPLLFFEACYVALRD